MKRKLNISKPLFASLLAGLTIICTIIGNMNDVIEFLKTLVSFSDKLDISRKTLLIIIISIVMSILIIVISIVIFKILKKHKEEKPMNDFLNKLSTEQSGCNSSNYINPFLSKTIESMMAEIPSDAKMYNADIMIEEEIDPTPYEATLAQKIACSNDVKDCSKLWQMLHEIPDSWTVFLNKEKKIISYWAFVALKEEKYEEISSGRISEKEIDKEALKFIDTSGRYKGYLLIAGTSSKCKTQKVRKELYDSWINYLDKLANENIYFDEILSMAGSERGITSLQNIGMKYHAEYNAGEKIFKYDLSNIGTIEYLTKFYPKLVEKYKNEYGG